MMQPKFLNILEEYLGMQLKDFLWITHKHKQRGFSRKTTVIIYLQNHVGKNI